jgi:hypothetical protein
MLEYFKRAFWIGAPVPGLGRVPVNALATLGFGILGFGHPAFWLLGAGLEAGFLGLLATHPRFQRLVDAERRSRDAQQADRREQDLAGKLDPEARRRLDALREKCSKVVQIARDAQAPDFTLESSRDALDRLQWMYLKLLIARHYLESSRVHASESDLKQRLAALDRDMAAGGTSASLRTSQAATLKILEQRLANLERCEQTLKEVDSDLARIEAQVDLALESATLQGGGAVVTANLELASQILEDGLYFGDAETAVSALDQAYSAPQRTRAPA